MDEPNPPAVPGSERMPGRKDPAGTVLVAYLRVQVQELRRSEPRVRRQEPDSVHRMRVATRRIRSALATYQALLLPGSVQVLRDEVTWLAGALAGARDVEVIGSRLLDLVQGAPSGLLPGPVPQRIDEYLAAAREQANAAVQQTLEEQRYQLLLEALEALVTSPPLAAVASAPAGKTAGAMIRREARKLRMAVEDAQTTTGRSRRDSALHEARKKAKRLRYAAEAAAAAGGERVARLAAAAQNVQTILGQHQDSVITQDVLHRLGAEAMMRGEAGTGYDRLRRLEEARAADLEAEFFLVWARFPAA